MADFLDALGQYASNRVDNATQPFTDPGTYAQNRLYGAVGMAPPGETEEERRRRLAREAAERGNTEVASQTVKTYADGSRENTVTTQEPPPAPVQQQAPQAQPAPVATAPTTAPQPAPVQQAPAPVQSAPQAQGPVAPVAPQMMPAMAPPAAEARPIINDQGQPLGRETPAQMVAGAQTGAPVAQPAPVAQGPVAPQMIPVAAPVAQGPVNPTAPAATAPALQPAPTPQPAPQPAWADRLTSAKTADDYSKIIEDPTTPPDIRRAAASQYSTALASDERRRQDEKKLETMTPTDLARAMTKRGEEGSYLKAILFARLGLNKLADEEQQKLGAGTKFESLMGPNGQRYTAEITGDGGISRAFDASGRSVDENTLAQLSANALAAKGVGHAGATRIRDSQGNEFSVVPTTRGSVFYKNNGELGTPVGATVPITTGSDVALEYNKRFYGAQGGAQGKAAGEGFVPGGTVTAPGMPGGQVTSTGYAPSATQIAAAGGIRLSPKGGVRDTQGQADQVAQWYAGGMKGPRPAEPGTSAHENDRAIDVPADQRTPENRRYLESQGLKNTVPDEPWHFELPRPTTSSGATIANPNTPTTTGAVGGPAQQRQALEVAGKRSESFNKIIDTEYRENGQKGEVISTNRKQQFDILNRTDPVTGKGMAEVLSGIATAANLNPNDQKLTMVRDILLGGVRPEKEIAQRAYELNLSPQAKGALQDYSSLNAQIAGQTLRETAGPGSVSDAEQAANKARNVDITKAPMLGAYNMMARSQFNGDIQRYKSDLSANTAAPNATVFDREFRKEQSKLVNAYREVTEARLDFIDKNGGANNPAAIREGYKRFPIPQYDVETGNWKYLKPLDKIFK